MAAADPHNLQRFIDAQHPIYGQVREELQAGQKESHWMLFIFPQIKGLGSSPTAQKYAIEDLDEAKAYLVHPFEEIFGYPDHLKFHSSITLFAQSQPSDNLFAAVLAKYFHGELDRRTLEQL